MVKHVGVYNDKRCVIIIQLPETPHLVHVLDTDNLPELYHQNLMEIVNSPEAQNAKWLGEVLARRMLHDGTNALRTFYDRGYIQEAPVEKVILSPRPNLAIPFAVAYPSEISVQDEKYSEVVAAEQAKLDKQLAENLTSTDEVLLHNQHADNLTGDKNNANYQIGLNLLAEAQLLEAEARIKRQKAAQYGAVDESKVNNTLNVSRQSNDGGGTGPYVDPVTGKTYKTASALKGAMTKRAKSANK